MFFIYFLTLLTYIVFDIFLYVFKKIGEQYGCSALLVGGDHRIGYRDGLPGLEIEHQGKEDRILKPYPDKWERVLQATVVADDVVIKNIF